MIRKIKTYYKKSMSKLRIWSIDKMFGLFLFNIIMMFLILLYTAGYFAPFFPLTINFIVFISLVISVFLLGIRSRTLLFISLLFWVFAAFLRIVKIEVWAERTAIYSYRASYSNNWIFAACTHNIPIVLNRD